MPEGRRLGEDLVGSTVVIFLWAVVCWPISKLEGYRVPPPNEKGTVKLPEVSPV